MNYVDLIDLFETKCLEVSEQFTVGWIEKLNFRENSYPLTHLYVESVEQYQTTVVYNLYLYYVDMLLDDRSNESIVQSDGLDILNDICNDFINDFNVLIRLPVVSTLFTEKFTSECAGVYVKLRIEYKKEC